jgi:hypothetical protein
LQPITELPWTGRPAIYDHIEAHIDPLSTGLLDGGETLPDEELVGGALRWAAGAQDGVFGHHFGAQAPEEAAEVFDALRRAVLGPCPETRAELYRRLLERGTIGIVDPLLERVRSARDLPARGLYELAHWLATRAPDREPVKIGIALLGLFPGPRDTLTFLTLGRHEELTLYCAVGLASALPDPEEDLWRLAQNVHGWGRIHLVERLARTKVPQIRDWLLREGYKNAILYEYLAFTCATAGDLRGALASAEADGPLLDAASDLIEALVQGGPAQDMDDYADGAEVTELYLQHLATHAPRLRRFVSVHAIRGFLEDPGADWRARAARGWSAERRARLLAQARAILERPEWPALVLARQDTDDEHELYLLDRVAHLLGVDLWQRREQRRRQRPLEAARWATLLEGCSEAQADRVVRLALELLPLERSASGAAQELGLGPDCAEHACLETLLAGLERFPGRGWALIRAGLGSPLIRNRSRALAALARWQGPWAPEVRAALRRALALEPDETLRERIHVLLVPGPLDL